MGSFIKADFHVHSIGSPDSLSKGENLYEQAKKIGLGKLIITDHNDIQVASALQKAHPDFVIVGEEILTTQGEILAIFVKEAVPKGLEPIEAFKRLKDQNAFISMSHPYAPMRHGWAESELESYLPYIDAIEICNGRNFQDMNKSAIEFARSHCINGTAGSDAHAVRELGAMGLCLPDFNNADELREAVKSAEVFGKESSQAMRFYSRQAVFLKAVNRKLGLKLYK